MTKIRNIAFLISLILLATAFSGCVVPGPEETELFSDNYETNENTVLKVTTVNGRIDISSWDGDTVALNATKKTRYGKDELEKVEIIVTEKDNEIEIEAKYPITDARVSVDMDIKVPRDVVVDLAETSNGAIKISGTKGDTKASTSNGAVEISDTEGNVTASTSNGAIKITDVEGYVKASASNGRIDVMGTTGVDNLETSNGAIYAEIFDIKNDIDIVSSNGEIILDIDPSLNADIEIETSNGEIDVNDITLELIKMEKTHLEGRLGEGGHRISIRTSNGDVELNRLVV